LAFIITYFISQHAQDGKLDVMCPGAEMISFHSCASRKSDGVLKKTNVARGILPVVVNFRRRRGKREYVVEKFIVCRGERLLMAFELSRRRQRKCTFGGAQRTL
jgi:hypothetical protein